MRSSRLAPVALAFCLVGTAVGAYALTGCKYTDVIREVIYTQDASEVDEETEPVINVVPPQDAQDEDQKHSDKEEIPDEKERAQEDLEKILAATGGDLDNGEGAAVRYAVDGASSGSSAASKEKGKGNGSADAFEGMDSDGETEADAADSGGSQGEGGSQGDGGGEGKGSSEGGGEGTGSGTDESSEGSSMDASGEYEKLPENVGTAAAAGEFATAVCMVAGSDALSATSADFKAGATNAISTWSSASTAETVFTSSGTLLDGGADTLVSLHAKGNCDAVFVESISQLGDDLNRIKNAGINVYTVSLDSLDKIQSSVKAIGKLFSEKTNGKSVEKADEYASFCSSVINTYKGDANQYTIYVSAWDPGAKWTVYGGSAVLGKGTGVAATKTGEAAIVTECLGKVGIINTAGTKAYAGQQAGLYWVSQFSKTVGTYTVTGSSLTNVNYSNKSANPTRVFTLADPNDADGTMLGSSGFKTVIANGTTVAKAFMNSRDNGGFYAPCDLLPERVTAIKGVGLYQDANHYALAYLGNGSTKGSSCYKVYTAPHGLYSAWTEGSVESVLLVAWAGSKYNGTSGLKDTVENFYKQFYGVALSSSQYNSIVESAGE